MRRPSRCCGGVFLLVGILEGVDRGLVSSESGVGFLWGCTSYDVWDFAVGQNGGYCG